MHLKILDLGIDTGNDTGELVLKLLGSVAKFVRDMMLERQRESTTKAKADGKYEGRAPIACRVFGSKIREVRATDTAKELEIGKASVYRILAEKIATEATSG